MKKIKLFAISALALVMALSLVFGIAAVKTAPATVNADPDPVIVHYYGDYTYAYVWKTVDDVNTPKVAWSGEEMIIDLTEGHEGWKTIEVTGYEKIIFNDGVGGEGRQTGDLEIGENLYFYNGTWYATFEEADDVINPKTTVYFYNAAGWEDVYAYVWSASGSLNAWPGNEMEAAGTANWYKFRYLNTYKQNVVFNNGKAGDDPAKEQTGDLNVETNLCYADGAWYASIDAAEEILHPVMHSIYFYNANDWENIYAYVWTDGGVKEVEWPGNAASQVGETKWYTYSCPERFTQVIFNNNAGGQTLDHVIAEGAYYYKNAWYATEEAANTQIAADIAAAEAAAAREALVAEKKAAMATKGGYFLIGCVREQTEWDFAEVTNALTTVTNSTNNVAEGWNISLKAGDTFKVVSADMTKWHGDTTEINAEGYEVTVDSDGIYNIYLSKNNKVYTEKIEGAEPFAVKGIKYKVSKVDEGSGKYYLLVVAGITIDMNNPYTGYELGLCINGDVWSDCVYYTGVSFKVNGEATTKTISDLFDGGLGVNALIIREVVVDSADVSGLEVIAYAYDTAYAGHGAIVVSAAYNI